ncbi:MAG: cysteine desulfurase [Chitinophagales bacterium]|nr:cysteine desulfurase [Chitinophagales bacterium]OJV29791.1 MAG: cysteine desulfurase [Bacteroidetes bacterium 37-13]
MEHIYLDNAATTPLDKSVLEEMLPYLTEYFGNPSSVHFFGRRPKAAIEKARKTVAHYLNASTAEIFFTSGGTESNNTALNMAVRSLGVKRIVSTKIEHDCVLNTTRNLAMQGTEVVYLKVDKLGNIDLGELENLLQQNKPTLVSIMHVNNEIGTIADLQAISNLCETYKAYLHSDTVQSIAYFPFNLQTLKVHFLSGSAHKFHGPKGVGFLYINGDARVKPFIFGGGQERNMRAGTENVASIVGLGKALKMAKQEQETSLAHFSFLRNEMKKQLREKIKDVEFIESEPNCFQKILSVSLPPHENSDMILINLDIAKVAASGGSACSSGTERGSHVLDVIGVEKDRRTIRFSFSKFNTLEDVKAAVNALAALFQERDIVHKQTV